MKSRDPLLVLAAFAIAVLAIGVVSILVYSLRNAPPVGILILCMGLLAGCLLPLR